MATNEITIVQGEDRTLALTVEDENGAAYNLTSRELRFAVRKKQAHQDNSVLISKSSSVPAEITITDAANGLAEIYIIPTDTEPANSVKPGNHVYDVWLIEPDTTQFSIIPSELFRIDPRVTVI